MAEFSQKSSTVKTYTTADFKRWGRQGGKKSRRTLTTEQAKRMNQAKAQKA